MMTLDPFIAKLERHQQLTPEERATLDQLPTRLREFRKHESVAVAGESPSHSAIVVTGMAFRVKQLLEGERQLVAVHVPGDFVDLHSFVLHPLDHSVITASPALVALIPHDKLAMILKNHPRLTKLLMWDMALDAAISREWMAIMGKREAYRQIAHLFCELYLRMRQAKQLRNDGFDFPLSQIDVGDLCGLSSVHVNRSLQQLRTDGLVILEKGFLQIPDLPRLIKAAAFDPAYLHLLADPTEI